MNDIQLEYVDPLSNAMKTYLHYERMGIRLCNPEMNIILDHGCDWDIDKKEKKEVIPIINKLVGFKLY